MRTTLRGKHVASLGTVFSTEATTGGLQTWIKSNVIPLLLLVIAVMLFTVAQRGDNAKATKVVAGVVIALGVLSLATGVEPRASAPGSLRSSRGEVVRLPVDDEI